MPYISYNTATGKLIELSEELMYDGCPPSGMTITYTPISIDLLQNNYVWSDESRDYEPIT